MPSALTLGEGDRRELIIWGAACVDRILPLFKAERPDDRRLEDALTGSVAFAQGELTVGAARRLAFACHAAARDATDPAARATARAAGQAIAIAHMAAHARGVVRYTRQALVAAKRDLAEEAAWQRRHLPARFLAYVYDGDDARAVRAISVR